MAGRRWLKVHSKAILRCLQLATMGVAFGAMIGSLAGGVYLDAILFGLLGSAIAFVMEYTQQIEAARREIERQQRIMTTILQDMNAVQATIVAEIRKAQQ